ncbi:hypothetical protein [Chromobacterium sp. IRSSSOUMB001]|uniref:hypothetical protein n=1 Tax=Chromobacterium sp. IRSSSOUMB001 TaxID=2927123 RepID=UPI0020BF6B8C|nr:hypothetical protein [Chromobacterium sp. IRSSSOUMB001]
MKNPIGNMNFFEIKKCGLYRVGNDKVYGCDPAETFSLIVKWLNGRAFHATIPWDPNVLRSGRPNCYCKDFYFDEKTGDYFFVLWKSSDVDSKGEMWGVEEDGGYGTEGVVEFKADTKKKVIWGRPAYYWVVPSLNTVVSVKFDHSVCDSQMFEDWVLSCINNRVDHPGKVKTTTDAGYVRIEFSDNGQLGRFSYRFEARLRSLCTKNAKLEELAKKVTHIIKRETIQVSANGHNDERAAWLKFLSEKIKFVEAPPKSKSRQVEIFFEANPTAEELKDIINSNLGGDENKWDNVGFKTDKGIAWVNKYRLRSTINVSSSEMVIGAKKFFSLLDASRQMYLQSILEEKGTGGDSVFEVAM